MKKLKSISLFIIAGIVFSSIPAITHAAATPTTKTYKTVTSHKNHLTKKGSEKHKSSGEKVKSKKYTAQKEKLDTTPSLFPVPEWALHPITTQSPPAIVSPTTTQ